MSNEYISAVCFSQLVSSLWQTICDAIKKCVNSSYFQKGILAAILVNTLSMGIEYHNQVNSSDVFMRACVILQILR
jgi:hypothetical protein